MRLPAPLSLYAGLALLPFAAFVAWLATRERVSGAAVWAVIAINAAWVVESLWLAAAGPVALNTLGQGFVVAQALAVAVFAELEFFGLRRSRHAQPAHT